MITYYLLSSEIGSPVERARDKPSLLKNSRVRSGKSLFGNNLTKEWQLQNFLSQRQCDMSLFQFAFAVFSQKSTSSICQIRQHAGLFLGFVTAVHP